MNNPVIEVFVRHCNFSSNSIGKNRPEWFSKEKCWNNLKSTLDKSAVNLTIMFDGILGENHFIKKERDCGCFPIVEMNGGDDARSFFNMLNHIKEQNFNDETIIYLVEDDYIHKRGWWMLLQEVFTHISVDYVTLYDHADKYFLPMYDNLQTNLYVTPTSHWRTTPSTTNTYACKYKTLMKHFDIHKHFCDLEKGYTRDHEKFVHLWQNGSNLISCVPGYSTHCEVEYISPCVNWEKIVKETT